MDHRCDRCVGCRRHSLGAPSQLPRRALVGLAFGDSRRLAPVRPIGLYRRDFAAIAVLLTDRSRRSKPMRSKRAWAECAAGPSSTRCLTVWDLAIYGEGAWASRAGGTFAISTAAHAMTQHREGAIGHAFPDLEGVRDHNGVAADPCVALVTAAHSAMPMPPVVSVRRPIPASAAALRPPPGVSVTAPPDRLSTGPCTLPPDRVTAKP